ncbi:bromodomain-containing protein 8 isoform X3 [Protopterus annectens]|uniref:bromodomain-containing protein 8 isoform X3 n=1 Tax=Protopterus annectens TaxID=7888 RepID=UPI001CF9FA6A|nr:bromodomain-containing protein 8 isoform X3 [Protopterus annectens]
MALCGDARFHCCFEFIVSNTAEHKLLSIGPTEPWSIREKLCLASSVMRSGDQNWVSVSRAIKPFAEPGRPPDWFSQKHCASQYSELLETTETPKRKRGEKGEVVETVEDVIVRKLTAERIEELKKFIKESQERYRKLKKEVELIQAGHLDNKLEEVWNENMMRKKQEDEEAEMKRKATEAAYQARQAAKNAPKRLPGAAGRSPLDACSPGADYSFVDLSQPAVGEGSSLTLGSLGTASDTAFLEVIETPLLSSAPQEPSLPPGMDESPQKKLLVQKVTPPPSPLLSKLLKKGSNYSFLPTSPQLVGESEATVTISHGNTAAGLMDIGGVFPLIHGTELQLATSTVPASTAASGAPTLSRLLEAGPTQFSPQLASYPSVSSESVVKPGQPSIESVSQPTVMTPSSTQTTPVVSENTVAVSDGPFTLRKPQLLFNSPVSEPVPCESGSVEAPAMRLSLDSSDISMMLDSIKKECLLPGMSDNLGDDKEDGLDEKEDLDLADKMDIPSIPYSGDELDLGTVGDIIAIIEEKVDDPPDVLDAAVVEAALSLCEESDDSHSLTGPWETHLKEEVKQEAIEQCLLAMKEEKEESEEHVTECIIKSCETVEQVEEQCELEKRHIKQESPGLEQVKDVQEETAEPVVTDLEEKEDFSAEETEAAVKVEEETTTSRLTTEVSSAEMSSSPHVKSSSEDLGEPEEEPLGAEDALKEEIDTDAKCHLQDPHGDGERDEEEDAASEAASYDEHDEHDEHDDHDEHEEHKEEDPGELSMSETENEPAASESEDGYSVHNVPVPSHMLGDSIPSSPASSQFSVCSEDQEAIQAQKIWRKAIMLVWRAAANHRYANVFLQPVTDDIAPGYHGIVHRPMDLSAIKKNIENGVIRTTAEFQRDIMLMFQNAVMYNSSDHDVYHMAIEMQRDVLEQIQQFLATQLIMQTSESGISTKSLRGRDSTRKQDSSEKDSVPMGSPAFLLSLFIRQTNQM